MKKGFTIVELLVVIGILAILATIVVIAASGAMKNARGKRADAMRSALQTALDTYYAQVGEWPSVIEQRASNMNDTSYSFSPTEIDKIFQEVVGKAYGKGGGEKSMLIDVSALFVANSSKLKNSGWGCNDNHKNKRDSNFCGNKNCVSGMDFTEAVKKGAKNRISLSQMAFGYQGTEEGRFRRFKISYNGATDSVKVTK